MHSLHISELIYLCIRSVLNVLVIISSISYYIYIILYIIFPYLSFTSDVFLMFLFFLLKWIVNTSRWELNATQDFWDRAAGGHSRACQGHDSICVCQSVTSCQPIQSPLLGKDWVTIMPPFPCASREDIQALPQLSSQGLREGHLRRQNDQVLKVEAESRPMILSKGLPRKQPKYGRWLETRNLAPTHLCHLCPIMLRHT